MGVTGVHHFMLLQICSLREMFGAEFASERFLVYSEMNGQNVCELNKEET